MNKKLINKVLNKYLPINIESLIKKYNDILEIEYRIGVEFVGGSKDDNNESKIASGIFLITKTNPNGIKIDDYCKARGIDKEKLLKDLFNNEPEKINFEVIFTD